MPGRPFLTSLIFRVLTFIAILSATLLSPLTYASTDVCSGALGQPFKKFLQATAPDEAQSRFAFSYAAANAFYAQTGMHAYWLKRFNLNIPAEVFGNAHLNADELVAEVILAYTVAGDEIYVPSKYARGHSAVLNRNLGSIKNANVVVLEDPSTQELTDTVDILRAQNLETPLIVIRRERGGALSENSSVLALTDYPAIIESIVLGADHKLTSPFAISMGNPRLMDRLMATSELRGQWLGRFKQLEIQDYLETQTTLLPTLSTASVHRFEGPAHDFKSLLRTAPAELVHVSTYVGLFPGFYKRDWRKTFGLALGQPNVELQTTSFRQALEEEQTISVEDALNQAHDAVIATYATDYGVALTREQVLLANGASGGLLRIMSAMPRGSRIALPEIAYATFQNMAHLLGLNVERVPLDPQEQARWTPAPDTKMVVVNYPHNPTGELMNPEVRAMLQRAAQQNILVVNDLTYPRFAYDGNRVESLLEGVSDIKNYVEIHSGSKDVGLPEERVSALVGDADWIARLRDLPLQHEQLMTANRLMRFARAHSNRAMFVTDSAEMQARRDAVVKAFADAGWPSDRILVPKAGMNVTITLPPGLNSEVVAKDLWLRAGVMVMPGSFFGYRPPNFPEFLRVSLSEDSTRLQALSGAMSRAGFTYDSIVNPTGP